METTQAPPAAPTISGSSGGIFGSNIPASVSFIVAILLFLLPFAEVKCGNEKIANQTGVGFAMNSEWKPQGMFDQKNLQKNTTKNESPVNSQMIMIAVLVLIIMGLVLSLANRYGGLAGLMGLISVGGLVYFMVDLKNDFNANLKKDAIDDAARGANDSGLGDLGNTINDMKPSLSFTPWFWIAVVVLLAAAVFSWQRGRQKV